MFLQFFNFPGGTIEAIVFIFLPEIINMLRNFSNSKSMRQKKNAQGGPKTAKKSQKWPKMTTRGRKSIRPIKITK